MAFTIQHKRKTGGVPQASDFSAGELIIDTTNDDLYFSTDGTDVIRLANFDDIAAGAISDGDTLVTGLTFPNTGLHIIDTDASHDLIIKPNENLTADRTLNIETGDADATLTISGSFSTTDVTDLITLSGKPVGSTDLGTAASNSFSNISDNRNITQALGDLDVAIDGINTSLATGYQASDDLLQDIADISGTSTAADQFLVSTGVGTFALEDAATARTSLGLGTADSVQFGDATVTNLTVNGTTTTVNTTELVVADKLITLADGNTTHLLADGAGIEIEASTDGNISLTYDNTNNALTSTENLNVATGLGYQVNGTSVLNATTLGSGVVTSSLTTLGAVDTGSIDCGTIA